MSTQESNTPSINDSGKYVICDGWGHIFTNGGKEKTTRWVYDVVNDTLYAQVLSGSIRPRWSELNRELTHDLMNGIYDNDVLDHLDAWEEVVVADHLPDWAAGAASLDACG